MKKTTLLLFFIAVFVALTVSITACNNAPPDNIPADEDRTNEAQTNNGAKNTYVVEFIAQNGGKIYGISTQYIKDGESTEKVTAEADEGYYFAGWVYQGSEQNVETITDKEITVYNVKENCSYTATFKRMVLNVRYTADGHGTIEGALKQNCGYGESTESVTAVPNIGYRFLSWSDGLEEATRREENLQADKNLTAYFEPLTKEFIYNYKNADRNCEAQTVTLKYGETDEVKFAVPEREHSKFGGWYADRYLTRQVADEKGNAVYGDDLIFIDGTRLYAKWIAENTHPYKILIVYVTELNAELTKSDLSGTKQVNYKMTETERKLCSMITEKISFELNDLAVANFQVDEFFTTVPLTKENVREERGIDAHTKTEMVDNEIYAYNIPEIQERLDKYDSILVSFSMNDYYNELRDDSGAAGAKYGNIHFDGCFTQLFNYHEPIENLLDPLHFYWDELLDTYLHEFAHTIHLRVNGIIGFHEVLNEYLWDSVQDRLIPQKLYFLNKAVIDGKTVGVPYEFWEGKVAKIFYEAQEGGKISNEKHSLILINEIRIEDDLQYVIYGKDAMSVTATALKGFEFMGWSDGVETPTRNDLNITEDLHVYAMFKQVE